MPPRHPLARPQPPSSLAREARGQREDDPIVVTASGVDPSSPAKIRGGDSPFNLRSRLFSPRTALAQAAHTSSDDQGYPSSPTRDTGGGIRSKILSMGKGRPSGAGGGVNGGRGWMKLDIRSPPREKPPLASQTSAAGNLNVPRSDPTRGPTRDRSTSSNGSHASGYRERNPQTRYANGGGSSSAEDDGGQLCVPMMSYSHGNPSYTPYGPNVSPRPGSMYSQTRSESRFSETSTSHLRRADDGVGANLDKYSISSRGGPKHLDTTFRLPSDPLSWSNNEEREVDDDLHDPKIMPRHYLGVFTPRGVANIGCLLILFFGILMLFAGYPLISYYARNEPDLHGAYNIGGINGSGQVGNVGFFTLIDADTPQSAYTHTSLETGDSWDLVFSDEFNRDGRSFYDGDDPFWEAADLHYWQTANLEWYDPRTITTKNGSLVITLYNTKYNGLNYMGGMLTSWNRFCFTGGYVEASVSLPGKSTVPGLWPAIWTMGNLGRAGYGGTLEGLWPYSYDECDVGTLPNQTLNGEPEIALKPSTLSYLPGQRLSRCTCPSDTTHPGPKYSDGSFKGRAAPEIDMFEAGVDVTTKKGAVSQSAQWGPFNPNYYFINDSNSDYEIYQDSDETRLNTYLGGIYQQATSALTNTDQKCYTAGSGCKSVYAFEYEPGTDGYITWVTDSKKTWTIRGAAMAANPEVQVGARPVSEEPMYLIVNLGISESFGDVDYDGLEPLWPMTMEVDYIRVYQDPSKSSVGCDPESMPTASYIAQYPEAYTNPNITTFDQIPNAVRPKNKLTDTC